MHNGYSSLEILVFNSLFRRIQELYCSNECRKSAYNSYHRVECKMYILTQLTSVEKMALRSFLIGTEQGAQLQNLMQKMPKQDLFRADSNPSNEPFVNDYLATLSMCRTYNSDVGDFIQSFVGSMITALRSIGFFEKARSKRVSLYSTKLCGDSYSITCHGFCFTIQYREN